MPLSLPKLPCGCSVTTNKGRRGGRPDVFIISDSLRVCRHGKVWRLAWIQERDLKKS